MGYKTFIVKQDVEFIDIQTMGEMTLDEYKEYLDGGLFFIDHHDVLRSQSAGYPLAVTKAQVKALAEYIKSIESKVGIDR